MTCVILTECQNVPYNSYLEHEGDSLSPKLDSFGIFRQVRRNSVG